MSTTKVTDNLRDTTQVDGAKITTGTIPEARITSLDATKLTGTIADARFPATLPAISGANLTNLPATADEITKSTSEPTGTINPSGGVGTLWLRTTTGEMYCCTDATTNANVWTNIGDGTGVMPFTAMTATGGTITTSGDYKISTFTSSGTWTVSTVGDVGTVEVLIVGGGGSGGSGYAAGGGAGGVVHDTDKAVSAQAYTITIGAGGASVTGEDGNAGSNSSAFSMNGVGGGFGGGYQNASGNGGSGGGQAAGSGSSAGTSTQTTYSGADVYGNSGGNTTGGGWWIAGGGGAGAVGQDADNSAETTGKSGNGGVGKEFTNFAHAGTASNNTGTSGGYFAGGGGGGAENWESSNNAGGLGGAGGGGNNYRGSSSTGAGNPGATNTGGGGAGATNSSTSGTGHTASGAGGSGIVMIRWQFQ